MNKLFHKSIIKFLILFLFVFLFVNINIAYSDIILVANERSGTISVVDLDTDKVIKTITVGKVPHAIGLTPDKRYAYIGNRGTNDISMIDLEKLDVIKTIPLSHTIMNLEVSPDGKYVSANSRTRLKVSIIETSTNSVIKTIPVGDEPFSKKIQSTDPAKNVVDMGSPDIHAKRGGILITHDTWSPDGRFLYVPDRYNYNIVKITLPDFKIAGKIHLRSPTHHIIVSKDGKTLYAANDGIHKKGILPGVTIIKAEDMSLIREILIPLQKGEYIQGHHANFDRSGRYLYFCNRGKKKGDKRGRTVGIIDMKEMKLIKTIETGHGAGHPNPSPDGKYVFILNHYDNKITVIDANRFEIVKQILLPIKSGASIGHSGVFSKDGRYYYQLSETDGLLFKVDVKKLQFVKSIKVGGWPSIMVIK